VKDEGSSLRDAQQGRDSKASTATVDRYVQISRM
jgi:hypothetical protein